jgi:uncharacterized protein (DUF1800 family)
LGRVNNRRHPYGRGEEEEEEKGRPHYVSGYGDGRSDVETINIEEEEDDARSPSAAMMPPTETPSKVTAAEERATETPRKAVAAEGHSRSDADVSSDAGSQKRAKKAPPKPIKSELRSASK